MQAIERSTHLVEKRRKIKDPAFEALLEAWGVYLSQPVTGLGANVSSLAVAVERYKSCVLTWEGTQPKQTRVTSARVPSYWVHKRLSQVNVAVNSLHSPYKVILQKTYGDQWDTNRCCFEWSMRPENVYNLLSRAKKALKQHENIKELLNRGC